MSSITELRTAAAEIFNEALRAVEPTAAVRNAVRLESSRLTICGRSFDFSSQTDVFGVAIGKAAERMALALEDVFGDHFVAGVISAPSRAGSAWDYFQGGHPLPNAASLEAAKAAFHLLDLINHENSLIFFLVSGGGSAMLESPISDDITLEDLRTANQVLVSCGAPIGEINAVRRAFSAVKGGRLATYAPKAQQVTLIVSDVPAGEEYNVASGPTLPSPTNAPTASEVVARYDLSSALPASILRVIEAPAAKQAPPTRHEHFVLLNNDTALDAAAIAARTRGFGVDVARDVSDDQIGVGCEKLLTRIVNLQQSPDRAAGQDVCLISGGEFACPVRGDGIGGRNLETALRLAITADQSSDSAGDFVAICAGTDGIDGNSLAAGAIVDSTTIQRARAIGFDANDFLNRSDAGTFFAALGDAIEIGPTGTNVRDVRILLAHGG